MKKLTEDTVPCVLEYLKKDIPNCLYMYIDIAKYGIENENVLVWYDTDDEGRFGTVLMKYYNSISIYSAQNQVNISEIVEIIDGLQVSTINGKKAVIEAIVPFLNGHYNAEYGYVFKFTNAKEIAIEDTIETAAPEDTKEIAELICMDEDFGSMYNAENLAKQLRDRMLSDFGRSYVIRRNGRMIAHIASYAEFDHIATTSGLVVAKDCQNGLYGLAMENYLVNRLWEDGFDVYTFVTKNLRRKLLKTMGNELVGEYGKLTVKKE